MTKNVKVEMTDIEKLTFFAGNPFKVKEDDSLKELAESIKESGIIEPLITVKGDNDTLEIISGQRRYAAAKSVGIKEVPVIIKNLSREDAIIFIVDSNVNNRDLLPSEKAFAYKIRLEAMRRKAGRPPKENASPVATNFSKGRADEELGEITGESKDTIRRYVRLTELIPELRDLVDSGRIAMRPAVELSYLPKEAQDEIYSAYEDNEATPSYSQAVRIRKAAENGDINRDTIREIMDEEKPNQVNKLKIAYNKLPRGDKLLPFVGPGKRFSSLEDFMLKAAEYYLQHLERMRNRDAR